MLGAVAGAFRAGDVLQGLESISKHSCLCCSRTILEHDHSLGRA